MVMRPLPRPLPSLFLCVALAALTALPQQAGAAGLDAEACNKLRTEQQSLTVLGVNKYYDQGAEWAKANLKPADLSLVKRYLDVFEQIKFRCEKVVALVEPDEKDEDEEEAVADGNPPVPERNATRSFKASLPIKTAAPTPETEPDLAPTAQAGQAGETEAAKIVNSTDIAKSPGKRPANATSVQIGPRRDLPAQ